MAFSNLSRQKHTLRRQVLAARHSMGAAARKEASTIICSQIAALPAFQQAGTIAGFSPMPEEVNLWPLLSACWENGKRLFFPRVNGPRQMTFHRVLARHELQPGTKDILEPPPHAIIAKTAQIFDFALIPAVAIDSSHYRLGYGGGFYDTFLSNLATPLSCAPVFTCQIVSQVPLEAHDQSVFCFISN